MHTKNIQGKEGYMVMLAKDDWSFASWLFSNRFYTEFVWETKKIQKPVLLIQTFWLNCLQWDWGISPSKKIPLVILLHGQVENHNTFEHNCFSFSIPVCKPETQKARSLSFFFHSYVSDLGQIIFWSSVASTIKRGLN